MDKALVIINESHSLLEDQRRVLESEYPGGIGRVVYAPKDGWSFSEIVSICEYILDEALGNGLDIVFVSPVHVLLNEVTKAIYYAKGYDDCRGYKGGTDVQVRVFHNDYREKKVLGDGRVLSVVAETGWRIV